MQTSENRFNSNQEYSDNIICVPFAFKEGSNTGVNVRGDAFTVYLKNACVSLCSIKFHNPECEVAFVTNIPSSQIPEVYVDVLKQFNILIVEIPFDSFIFADKYLWSLAFYKLCILKHYSKSRYKNICYMDSDVYVQENLNYLWEECEQNILLYDINHGLQVEDYRVICEEFASFFGEKKYLTHYGGEFFAASIENTRVFVNSLENIYQEMRKRNFVTSKGDEFLISITASIMRGTIKNAGAYIYRFWTAPGFRLVSTCYQYNNVSILHLPNEKNRGMLRIYNLYIKKGKIPSNQTVWRICRLSSFSIVDRVKNIIKLIWLRYSSHFLK